MFKMPAYDPFSIAVMSLGNGLLTPRRFPPPWTVEDNEPPLWPHAAKRMLNFFPPRPINAAAALDRIELLAVKSLHELLRVRWFLKAVDVKPLAVVMQRVTSRAKRQVSTERMYLVVAVAFAQPRR